MEQFTIGKNEDGKRLDAVAMKLLPQAGKGFIYKMLRKKNIVLNDKKADGNERVSTGDVIKIYLSDETFRGFGGVKAENAVDKVAGTPAKDGDTIKQGTKLENRRISDGFCRWIIYEDEDIMLINKPVGVLSQKAENDDISINEMMIDHLLEEGKTNDQELRTFKPSVCNRLDRNTSGIVCAGISLKGSRELTRLIREREAEKLYMCIVSGIPKCGSSGGKKWTYLKSFLNKDEKSNKVKVSKDEFPGSAPVEIEYRIVKSEDVYSLLEVRLITGKSHQIRAQLASIGHPIAGDVKYGERLENESLRKKYGVKRQLLHAYNFTFPKETVLENVKGVNFTAELPGDFFIRPDDDRQ
ncbi:MAG: RluA family pseudouridine synthase [Lachnospiraceae bacterium]|nr:RluA family pseudouridine synthase [Lachnospiraceae bacterium]